MFIGEGKFESILLEIDKKILKDVDIFSEIENIKKRPLNSLFKNRDRFLVKIYRREFSQLARTLGLDIHKFNIEDGYYLGNDNEKMRYGTLLKDIFIRKGKFSLKENLKKDLTQLKHMLQQRNVFSYALFSRNPIDVIRMSDIGGMESCHSPGHSHFNCAVDESRNSGGVVYEIDAESSKRISKNLNISEVFEDPDRDIPGIVAKSRVRLRMLYDVSTGKDYAIPEDRFYVPAGNVYGYGGGFSDLVRRYVRQNQENPPEELLKDEKYVNDNIYHIGGSYSDTEITVLVNKLLGIHSFKISNHVNTIDKLYDEHNFLTIIHSDNPKKELMEFSKDRLLMFIKFASKEFKQDKIDFNNIHSLEIAFNILDKKYTNWMRESYYTPNLELYYSLAENFTNEKLLETDIGDYVIRLLANVRVYYTARLSVSALEFYKKLSNNEKFKREVNKIVISDTEFIFYNDNVDRNLIFGIPDKILTDKTIEHAAKHILGGGDISFVTYWPLENKIFQKVFDIVVKTTLPIMASDKWYLQRPSEYYIKILNKGIDNSFIKEYSSYIKSVVSNNITKAVYFLAHLVTRIHPLYQKKVLKDALDLWKNRKEEFLEVLIQLRDAVRAERGIFNEFDNLLSKIEEIGW